MGEKEDNELAELGNLFHSYRVGRGLTLDEVSGSWSVATLSRFEHGKIELSTDKALGMMTRLGIDEYDFYEFYAHNRTNFPIGMRVEIKTNDIVAINKREQQYFAVHQTQNNATRLARILFICAQHWPDAKFYLSAEDEQTVADFLSTPGCSALVEEEFLMVIPAAASHELLALIWKRLRHSEFSGGGVPPINSLHLYHRYSFGWVRS